MTWVLQISRCQLSKMQGRSVQGNGQSVGPTGIPGAPLLKCPTSRAQCAELRSLAFILKLWGVW